MLDVRDLEVVYQRGGEPAARDVTLTLGPGDAVLLTGEHGSGKTSVLRAVLGLVVASGEVTVLGRPAASPEVAARRGYGPQGRAFMEGHTPRQLVHLVAALRMGRSAADIADEALERAGIPHERRRVTARSLDVEEIRRVALACAIATDPDLIVLDDPWEFPETALEIERARARGAAVLVATDEAGGFTSLLGRTITLVEGAPT